MTDKNDIGKFDITDQNRVRRVAKRGIYDGAQVYAVIDAAWLAHVGIVDETTRAVTVIPMLHGRIGDSVIFHGANSSRLIRQLCAEQPVSLSFTLVDGLVLAKSLFHHSMNYRSVVVFGRGSLVEDPQQRIAGLKAVSDRVLPGRWNDAREPNERELAATAVVQVAIESASAKIRTGDPLDDPEDLELSVWSGVVPVNDALGAPITDPHSVGIPVPQYVRRQIQAYNS